MTEDRSRRVFRIVLRLLPESRRRRHGEEMEDLLLEHLRQCGGRGDRTIVWFRAVLDVVSESLRDRLSRMVRGREHGLDPDDYTRPTGASGMDHLLRDLRFAVRVLVRNRGFTLAALLTLALGIGANAAIFTVVNTVLLSPLPYGEPDRLMIVWMNNRLERIERDITSFPSFSDWRSASRSFESLAAYSPRNVSLTAGQGDPEQLRSAFVTEDFFDVLGVSALTGRVIGAAEVEPAGSQVIVLGHGLWQRRFGGDAGIVGQSIRIADQEQVVIGVMPPGFEYPDNVELWQPLAPVGTLEQTMQSRGSLWLAVIGRLRPGVTLESAQTEMTAIAARLEEEFPADRGRGILLEPLHESVVGTIRPALVVLLGAVAFVLLIACANVANLLLARGASRRREVSVRLAVGASGSRLARQLLTESIVLALTGGLIGFALAVAAVSALAAASPPGIPRLDELGMGASVIFFTCVIALGTGIVFGLAPAFQAARAPLSSVLRDAEKGDGAYLGRVRPLLVIAEIALALMLLVGAGLMIRTAIALQSVDSGFDPENVLTARFSVPTSRYPEAQQVRNFRDQMLDAMRAQPGVQSVAAVTNLFLARLPNMGPISMEGAAPRGPDDPVISVVNDVATAEFFETMRIRVIAGRTFGDADVPDAPPVVVVNETFVRQFVSEGNAVGRRFQFGDGTAEEPQWFTIVGVIEDTRRSGPAEPIRPEAFLSHSQFASRTLTLLVRTSGEPLLLTGALRAAFRRADPAMPLAEITTVQQQMARALSSRRFTMQVLILFAGVAAMLAAVGIYGVMAYLVARRTREMGVRLAVGAAPGDVVRLVIRSAARQVLPGLAIGLAGALALTRWMRSQLFGVQPTDPLTYAGVAIFLGSVALLASWLPARKAARVDPITALRNE